MGGEQSGERTTDRSAEQQRAEETDGRQQQVEAHGSAAASQETPGELPQCLMGNRKVDDMRFMISCTNWY